MNPFQQTDTTDGVCVFYNKATKQYFKETNLSFNDFYMMEISPVFNFIGFFKSQIQAQDTIEACIKLDSKVQKTFIQNNTLKNMINHPNKQQMVKTKAYYDNDLNEEEELWLVDENDIDDLGYFEYYVDDLSNLPEVIGSIVKSINKPVNKTTKKNKPNKQKKKGNKNEQ